MGFNQIILLCFFNLMCWLIGYTLGRASVVQCKPVKPVEEPVEPVEAVEPAPAAPAQDAEATLQRRRFEAIMANIDNYDGTEQGQKDVPWR